MPDISKRNNGTSFFIIKLTSLSVKMTILDSNNESGLDLFDRNDAPFSLMFFLKKN